MGLVKNESSWIGFKIVILKPFTNLRHFYFQFFNYFIETFFISIRFGIVYITIKFYCAIFLKQIAYAYDEIKGSEIPKRISGKLLKLEPLFFVSDY